MKRYEVSIDPYDSGARFKWVVTAKNKTQAKRKARSLAVRDGWMRAGWRGIEVKEIGQTNLAHHARKNPTKAQKRLNASKRSKQKRVAVALRKYLQQQNPGTKLAGAKVEKLKGGVLKITPIKANRTVKR